MTLCRHVISNKIDRLLGEHNIRAIHVQNKKSHRDAEVCQGRIRSDGSRAYIGFHVISAKSMLDRGVWLLWRCAKDTRGTYISISARSQQWQNITCRHVSTVQLKIDGTRWRTGGEVKGKLANGVGSQYSSHYLGTWCIQHYCRWCAHLGCQ